MATVKELALACVAAGVLWLGMFSPWTARWVPFWAAMTISSCALATWAILRNREPIARLLQFRWRYVGVGVASAAALYGVFFVGHHLAGAVTHQAPLLRENGFLVDFDAIPVEVRRLAKVLWLNYPNNPTTATADLDFFERAVEFGRQNDILIIHDSAYSENTYDGYVAPSILQVDGADEVACEFFSLSKAFCMTGWRTAALVGNASAVAALSKAKDNVDNGVLRAIQFAAAKALDMAEELIPPMNEVYKRRRDMVVDALNTNGWSIEPPKATIYIWAPVPEKYDGKSAEFATDLLEQAGVVVTPGLGYGQWGEGNFRISLTYPEPVLEEALVRIMEFRV